MTSMLHFEQETEQMEVEKYNMQNILLRHGLGDEYYIENYTSDNVRKTNFIGILRNEKF